MRRRMTPRLISSSVFPLIRRTARATTHEAREAREARYAAEDSRILIRSPGATAWCRRLGAARRRRARRVGGPHTTKRGSDHGAGGRTFFRIGGRAGAAVGARITAADATRDGGHPARRGIGTVL